jgi:hypothetical protein
MRPCAYYERGMPAVVADIGGGPGRYALWLASLGYQVEHRDLMHARSVPRQPVISPGAGRTPS